MDVRICPTNLHMHEGNLLQRFPRCLTVSCSAVFNVKTLSRCFLTNELSSPLINNACCREQRQIPSGMLFHLWRRCDLFYHRLHLSHLQQGRGVAEEQRSSGRSSAAPSHRFSLQTLFTSIHSSKLIWKNENTVNIDRIG